MIKRIEKFFLRREWKAIRRRLVRELEELLGYKPTISKIDVDSIMAISGDGDVKSAIVYKDQSNTVEVYREVVFFKKRRKHLTRGLHLRKI